MPVAHGPCRFQQTLLSDTPLTLRTGVGATEAQAARAGLDFPGESWSCMLEERQLMVEKEVDSVRHEAPRDTVAWGGQSGKHP